MSNVWQNMMIRPASKHVTEKRWWTETEGRIAQIRQVSFHGYTQSVIVIQ